MSSALEIIYGVRAMAPQADPFAIIVNQIEIKLSPDMGSSYIPALRALHVIFALQAVLLVLSLVIRYRRSRGDMWIFRLRSTARGTVVLPHFAVAWQLWMLLFLVILQPYLVMEADHSMRKNWKVSGVIGFRASAINFRQHAKLTGLHHWSNDGLFAGLASCLVCCEYRQTIKCWLAGWRARFCAHTC